ncbi:peptide chain release factor 1 [Marmoricola sp. Leaf446]|uniref:Ribosome-associated protein n=1 Tax=Nocardioides aurantiacus TaxID=86796 RepID=A0A3N2CRT9_9ACTN|nr:MULTISPECIES: alternative ribosome rescue aminoacyl-tRNA hydrolase ArfB [Nocardioidaceae]KQT94214.1 peptide chain release factor 1 [Marmoricola sp. Leaf446]ROR90230.1 ribosome-associated protein [Nocardioides aurantiacus]
MVSVDGGRGVGAGLQLRPGPGVPSGLTVPEGDLVERFSRSSGPGGQSVNTTDSRVEVLLDLTTTSALSDAQRERVVRTLGPRLAVTASEHRSQHRNRLAARQRLADRLREALAPPPLPRVPTKPTRGSQRRRAEGKKRRSQVKQLRGRVRD